MILFCPSSRSKTLQAVVPCLTLGFLAFCAAKAQAQIITDGSLGPGRSLAGPNYQIGSDLGKLYGSNLFHSFSEFNLQNGQSATFSGPAAVRNIVSRVTGGNPSSIDGSLNSSIAGANLFFINPSGIVFGANAQVNVSGSFVASTADVLKLADGSVFSAVNTSNAVLSSAPPAAFGFLGSNPAPIVINNSRLSVGAGKAMSFISGDIQLNGAELQAEKGKVNLVATGSAGEVQLDATSSTAAPVLTGFGKLGDIGLNGARVDVGDQGSAGNVGGSVSVVGENLTMENESEIRSRNRGTTEGGSFDFNLRNTITMREDSSIATATEGNGRGANVTLKAANIDIQGFGFFNGTRFAGVRATSEPGATGNAGNINIETGGLKLENGARISANTSSAGRGGDVTIKADRIAIDGRNASLFTGIAVQTLGTGTGGNANIETGSLEMRGGSEISASTLRGGDGGTISVKANDILVDGAGSEFFTGIVASTFQSFEGGDGGNISLNVKTLTLQNGGQVSVRTRGSGTGGTLTITADDVSIFNRGKITGEAEGLGNGGNITVNANNILLDGQGEIELTGITTVSQSPSVDGKAGDITLNAKNIQLIAGGRIVASTARGSARGGNVTLKADDILLDGKNGLAFTSIVAQAQDTTSEAVGGNIDIQAKNLTLLNSAEITASTNSRGASGSINIQADKVLVEGQFRGFQSLISASTFDLANAGGEAGKVTIIADELIVRGHAEVKTSTFGGGNGGSVNITADTITVEGTGASILAQTTAFDNAGNGGDINLTADKLTVQNDGVISASTENNGAGGNINVNASSLNVLSGGNINAGTTGTGPGGSIRIKGDSVLIDGSGSSGQSITGISAQTEGGGRDRGPGGSIEVDVNQLEVANNGTISTTTLGTAPGGNITVKAENVRLSNSGSIQSSSNPEAGIAGRNRGGRGGDITMEVGTLDIASGAAVRTDSLAGGGRGGAIDIHARKLVRVTDGGSISVAAATANGGQVRVQSDDTIEVQDAQITSAAGRNGGNIVLNAARMIYLRNSRLSAIANGNGGNIDINQPQYVIFDKSQVRADAINGNGGNITIRSRVYLPSIESIVSASSQFGVAGNIAIQSPNTNVGGSLIQLPTNPLDAESFLPERCVVKQTGQSSSFTVDTRRDAPPLPGDSIPGVAIP